MKWIFSSISGLIGVVFLVIGCPFLAVAGGVYYFLVAEPQDWVLVKGTVTRMYENDSVNSDGFSSTTYCPSVEFTTTDGETIELDINECSSPPAYSVGDTVELYYDPANPQNVQLKGGVRLLVGGILGIVFGILGAVFCLVGGVMTLVGVVAAAWRNKTPAQN